MNTGGICMRAQICINDIFSWHKTPGSFGRNMRALEPPSNGTVHLSYDLIFGWSLSNTISKQSRSWTRALPHASGVGQRHAHHGMVTETLKYPPTSRTSRSGPVRKPKAAQLLLPRKGPAEHQRGSLRSRYGTSCTQCNI